VAGVHTLHFTSYSYYGKKVKSKSVAASRKKENTNKFQKFSLYKHHSFSKQEKRKKTPLCLYLQ
jgi:hypothetical protein